jgi:hypothetical protein
VLFVTPRNDAFEFAATTEEAEKFAEVTVVSPDESETRDYLELAAARAYDLIIYDQFVPKEMPQANTLFIGNVPPVEGWSQGDLQPLPVIIDTDQTHPLTYLVEMGGVKFIYDGFAVEGPEGATTLFDSNIGALFVIGQRDGFEDAVLGFEIIGKDNKEDITPKTDWPGRRSFPVFVMNALRYLGGLRRSFATSGVQPGKTVTVRPHYPVSRIEIESPSGLDYRLQREGQNAFSFGQTEELGIYQVREGRSEDISQRFAVNLFDSRESNLVPNPNIEIGYETVTAQSGMTPTRQELWRWLMLLGVCVLLFEWYVYNRRVYL